MIIKDDNGSIAHLTSSLNEQFTQITKYLDNITDKLENFESKLNNIVDIVSNIDSSSFAKQRVRQWLEITKR